MGPLGWIGLAMGVGNLLFGGKDDEPEQTGGGGGGGFDIDYSAADIDKAIAAARGMGARQIRGQLAQANVATSGTLAASGLGSSGLVTSAVMGNEAAAQNAFANLEANLSQQRLQELRQLAALKAAAAGGGGGGYPTPEKPSAWDYIGALGGNLLSYELTGGGSSWGNLFGGKNSGGRIVEPAYGSINA